MSDETTARLLATTDAQVWAKEWVATAAAIVAKSGHWMDVLDEGWMIGWFANAIETGRGFANFGACPYVVTDDEGTSYCTLAERTATDG